MQTLERHAMPRLGHMPVDRIGREDVLAVLTPIWATVPETARRVRQRIRATLRWCWAHGYVEQNVAGEAIDGALPKMPAIKSHFRALPYRGRLVSTHDGGCVESVLGGEAVSSVPDPHGGAER